MFGLLLLVVVHLVSALHGPGFAGPHAVDSAAAGGGQSIAVVASEDHAHVHDPEIELHEYSHGHRHGHGHGDGVAHAVDRLREPAGQPVISPDSAVALLVDHIAVVTPLSVHPTRSRSSPLASDGGSSLALFCVWRQ